MEVILLAWTPSSDFLLWVFLVAVGLGAVIFVHELGHFLVAKACGVKCEKFFLGFDIGGIKISRQWGETEYGIGILPFGGYVKMLGQDDNPAKMAEEMERSRVRRASRAEGDSSADDEDAFQLDPRSYLAKSVPQRMAIISAGVVMNVIFAFVFAMIAYGMGVKYLPCVVSQVIPGSPAWRAGLQVGDEIVQIGDLKKPRFRDLKSDISLGDPQSKVKIQVRRPGVDGLLPFSLTPHKSHGLPTIGIVSPRSLTLYAKPPFLPGSPASRAKPALLGGDRIVAVDGQKMAGYYDLVRMLAQHRDEPLDVTVQRSGRDTAPVAATGGQQVTSQIAANPMKRLGLVMGLGPITAVQNDSPAAHAGIQAGDTILAIDGQPPGDPISLPDRLRRQAAAGRPVRLSISRSTTGGAQRPLEMTVPLRVATWFEKADMPGIPMSAPSLGIAYQVINCVARVVPGSPAAKVGIRAGDTVLQAGFIPDPEDTSPQAKQLAAAEPIPLGADNPNWAAVVQLVQVTTPGTTVSLTVRHGQQQPPRRVQLGPVASADLFNPERGLVTGPVEVVRRAESWTEAVSLAGRETKDALLMVFRFLKRLIDQQISPRLLGGPVTIAKVAYNSASGGVASLLIFLTVLSANLAVINFLPIPLLDGGHMVLLACEAVLRRPVSEKILITLQVIGFVLIIGVMSFVLALDFGLIPRGL